MNGPLLTIVVPAYNQERYLGDCLDAILGQMTADHELVVIDDGSSDTTAAVARAAHERHPAARATIVSQANQGIAGARNRGLAEAHGEYIVWVDSDDILLPGALAAIEAAARAHQPDVIACGFHMWSPGAADERRCTRLGYPANVLVTDREAILLHFLTDRHMYVWANVARRALYAQLPQPVFPGSRVFEDVAILARLLSQARGLVHIDRPLIDYRQHPGSITKSVCAKWCLDFNAALGALHDSLAALDVSGAVRLQADATVVHFWVGVVKCSYELDWADGRAVRAVLNEHLPALLFHPPEDVITAKRQGQARTHDAQAERRAADQTRRALESSVLFDAAMVLSRAIKRRRRQWKEVRAAVRRPR